MTAPRVRYGIVGFGRFAEKAIAPAFKQSRNSVLVAVQNRSLAKAQSAAQQHGVPLAFESVAALVAHPEVDAVFVASPNALHCEETVIAAQARKHVLVEKPMAMNMGECRRMIEVCKQNAVKLMVGHQVRLSPLVRRMHELVRSGAVGQVVRAAADFVYDGRLSTRSWLLDRKLAGGGPTFDVGVHCIDTLRFVLDDEVVSLQGELRPKPTTDTTEATSQLLMRFARGTIGVVFSSYEAPLRESRIEILGTEARLSAVDFTVGERCATLVIERRNAAGSPDWLEEAIDVPNLYVEEINHFSECILNNTEPVLTAQSALGNQRVLDAAMRLE